MRSATTKEAAVHMWHLGERVCPGRRLRALAADAVVVVVELVDIRDVRLRGDVRVAAGQSEISRVGIREMLAASSIDVCNFDVSWGGGPSEWRRVAALALAFDVELGHHEEAHLSAHLLASVPNGTFVEVFTPARDPIYWEMLANRKPLQDGCLPLPDGPGLGWELDEDFIGMYRVDR